MSKKQKFDNFDHFCLDDPLKLITYKIIEEMRKTEGIPILGPKITCLFYADDGLKLAKDKEKAERSIEIIREIGGKYGLQLNEQKSQCILFNMKEKYEKISNIEVVEEIKYLGVIVRAKRNVFEGQKNEIMKKIKRLSVMTNSVIEKKLPSSNDGENILERSGTTKRAVWSRSNRHESRRNR